MSRAGESMATVFLSYAREDGAKVRPLAAALERAGHKVWWDQHIGGGDQFARAIEQALGEADAVVVAWTEASVQSDWVRDEAAAGRDTGRLVPVTFDGFLPPLGFRQYQTIDLAAWCRRPRQRLLEPLLQAVAAKAGSAEAAAPRRVAASAAAGRPVRTWVAAGAATLLVLGGALFYPQLRSLAGPATLQPKVALGAIAIAPGVSAELPQAVQDEVIAAFGAENAVAVLTPGASGARAAPFVLDGSIRRLGDALRFTVNLRNESSGAVLWSNAFDRPAGDALAPRQVAVAASQVIRCGLWGASSYPKPMPDRALSLYLQWCNEYWGGSPDESLVLDSARRVVAALPDFSFGWSALALAAVPISHRAGSAEAEQVRKEGWAAAERATKLDPLNPEGYMAKAGLLPIDRFVERERLLTRAISVRPTECGCERQSYGDFLTSVGRMEEAAEEYQRARAMMPLAPFSNVRLAHALHVVGRHEEADRVLAEMLDVWPDSESLRMLKVKSAYWTADADAAVPLLDAPDLHLTRAEREALRATLEALKSKAPAERAAALEAVEQLAADPRRNDRLTVGALAALGAHDVALGAAARLIRERGHPLADVLFEPNLAAAAGTPGYARLVRQLGLAQYWKSTRKLPDICRTPRRPAFCTI